MPKLWSDTIESHRREVHTAILDATASLAAEEGLLSVTMSQIAEEAGVGRATLYKYFPDVESILVAWHERQVGEHLAQLAAIRDRRDDAGARLSAVLEALAFIDHEHHGTDLAAALHRGEHLVRAHDHLRGFVRELIAEAATAGEVRTDVGPDELAAYCLSAVAAAHTLVSKAAVRRLVQVVMDGLQYSLS